MGKGYAEGPAAEEAARLAEEAERGVAEETPPGRAAVFGCTEESPERHFLGWRDELDPDALFASGKAWGIVVRRRVAV